MRLTAGENNYKVKEGHSSVQCEHLKKVNTGHSPVQSLVEFCRVGSRVEPLCLTRVKCDTGRHSKTPLGV
jgi:hypothetical protein